MAPRQRATADERFSPLRHFDQGTDAETRSFSVAFDASAPEQPSFLGDADRPAPNPADMPQRPRGQAASAADAVPRVHIGRIDIVVQAAETVRQVQAPTRPSSDAASRFYLRRL